MATDNSVPDMNRSSLDITDDTSSSSREQISGAVNHRTTQSLVRKCISLPSSPSARSNCSSSSRRSLDLSFARADNKPKKCIMCGRRADVLHYGVAACSTCKTFFRRSLLSERELHCKRKEECRQSPQFWSDPRNMQRPGQCAWCRLSRFVSRGMNPCAVSPSNGKDLLEYPNVVKIFEATRKNAQTQHEYNQRLRIPPLSDDLEDVFLRVRRCDLKHRQLRMSEFNPKPKSRFDWGIAEYSRQRREMDRDLQELAWARGDCVTNDADLIEVKQELIDCDEEILVKQDEKKRILPIFALQKEWEFVDTICAIEYVKYFVNVMGLELDALDKLSVIRKSVMQIRLLEMNHFSSSAGFHRLTFPDGTEKSKGFWRTNTRPDSILEMMTNLSLTRTELSIMKAIIICNADHISSGGRESMENLKVQLGRILMCFCIRKFGDTKGIMRMTTIMDIFHAVETQKSEEIHEHVINYLDKNEPAVMRDLYYRTD